MRRYPLWLALILLLGIAGYSAYWLAMARQMERNASRWADARRHEGYRVNWNGMAVGGYPFTFRLAFTDADFGGSRPAPYDAHAPLLLLRAAPWSLRRWQATTPQGLHLAMPEPVLAIDATAIDGSIAVTETLTALTLDAHDITGNGALTGIHLAELKGEMDFPPAPPTDHGATAVHLDLSLANLTLPSAPAPFSTAIATANLSGDVKGRLASGSLPQSLAAWRDDGGTIEIAHGGLHWDALTIDSSGTLALDGTLQPEGALTATIAGQNEIIDAVAAAGRLSGQNAGAVKFVLGMLAQPGPDGGKVLKAPMTIQDQQLYLGPVKLMRLPTINWR